jgi:hypothetical protein
MDKSNYYKTKYNLPYDYEIKNRSWNWSARLIFHNEAVTYKGKNCFERVVIINEELDFKNHITLNLGYADILNEFLNTNKDTFINFNKKYIYPPILDWHNDQLKNATVEVKCYEGYVGNEEALVLGVAPGTLKESINYKNLAVDYFFEMRNNVIKFIEKSFEKKSKKKDNELYNIHRQFKDRFENNIRLSFDDSYWKQCYYTNDIFSVVLLELLNCIEHDIIPIKCSICNNYFFRVRCNKDNNYCMFCKPPSRLPRSSLSVRDLERVRLRQKIYQQYLRNGNLEEANRKLKNEGLKLINPRTNKK